MTQSEFLEIVMPFKDKLYRLAKRLLISSEEAEDATQEILMKLWSAKKKIASYRNVEAFAMTMTKNFCLDRLKSKQAGNLKLVHSNFTDGNSSLQKQVEVRDSLGWVQRIMDELPEQQRMVLQLRDVEAYDYEEIEKLMDMKSTAVRVTLSRARKAVREKLLEKHRYGIGYDRKIDGEVLRGIHYGSRGAGTEGLFCREGDRSAPAGICPDVHLLLCGQGRTLHGAGSTKNQE